MLRRFVLCVGMTVWLTPDTLFSQTEIEPTAPHTIGARIPTTFHPGIQSSSLSPSVAACSASGTGTADFGSSNTSWIGAWARRSAGACSVPGDWLDSFGYEWNLTGDQSGALSGTLLITLSPFGPCPTSFWPVTGNIISDAHFTVTAHNENPLPFCGTFLILLCHKLYAQATT
jgi:hypothetical protein